MTKADVNHPEFQRGLAACTASVVKLVAETRDVVTLRAAIAAHDARARNFDDVQFGLGWLIGEAQNYSLLSRARRLAQ